MPFENIKTEMHDNKSKINRERLDDRNNVGPSNGSSLSSSKNDLWQRLTREREQTQERSQETSDQTRIQVDNRSSDGSPEDVNNQKRAESIRDASTTVSTEQRVGKDVQNICKSWLKAAFIAVTLLGSKANAWGTNHTVEVEGMGPVVYGSLDQQHPWLDRLANRSNIGDSHGAMLQSRDDLEQQQFIKLRNITRRADDLHANQGTAPRRTRFFRRKGKHVLVEYKGFFGGTYYKKRRRRPWE